MSDPSYEGPERRDPERTTAQGLVDVRNSLDRVADGFEKVAVAITEQTRQEGEDTRKHIHALETTVLKLDKKVHYLRWLVVFVGAIAFAACLGIGTVVYRSFNSTGPTINDIADTTQQLNDCINPSGACYKANQAEADRRIASAVSLILAQQRCDAGIYCAPGLTPFMPPESTPTTTAPR